MKRFFIKLFYLFLLCFFSSSNAFVLNGPFWEAGKTTFNIDLPVGNDQIYNNAFQDAINIWSEQTLFFYEMILESSVDACPDPEVSNQQNSVKFSNTISNILTTRSWRLFNSIKVHFSISIIIIFCKSKMCPSI